MKEVVRKLLEKKLDTIIANDCEFYDCLSTCATAWVGDEESHRWRISFTRVVHIDGRFFGFEDYKCTGDNDAEGAGYDFADVSIDEFFPHTVEATVYKTYEQSEEEAPK